MCLDGSWVNLGRQRSRVPQFNQGWPRGCADLGSLVQTWEVQTWEVQTWEVQTWEAV